MFIVVGASGLQSHSQRIIQVLAWDSGGLKPVFSHPPLEGYLGHSGFVSDKTEVFMCSL